QECEQVIRALASQAAISLTNMNYAAEVQELLDSFVRVISTAIDARTPYNANHTRGMVRVGSQFIEWLNSSNGDWQFTPEKKRLFLMSVWFHDIGKLTVPLEIMDKASRLGQQVPAVGYRFQVISLLNKIALMEGRITQEQYQQCDRDLADADSLIREANQVYQQSADQAKRIAQLGKRTYLDEQGNEQPWLTAAELASLSIPRGTLSPEERAAMQNHVVMTSRMLQEMKFPPEYDCVPEWAGMHHEFLNGKGYPKGLSGQELPKEARLLTVLDIFDALTQERPYSPAQPVEQALAVLDEMAASGQLDTAIVAMFKDSHAWEEDTTGGGAV
ncbi:MAG: HD domain-containing phosphohydrolase, partial [Angelakisella sp.]